MERRLIDANALNKRFDERESDDIELYGVHIAECFPADEAKEIARLKRQLRDAQDALDVLKKAINILGK